MNEDLEQRTLQKLMGKAQSMTKDARATLKMLDQVEQKASRYRSNIKDGFDQLKRLIKLCRAWVRGEYRQIPAKSLLFAMAAILYFLNPLDLISDFLPGAGLIDDMAMLGLVIRSIAKDLELFEVWEEQKNTDLAVTSSPVTSDKD
jgi:uncharacterized membrane protein YkvA (DUF1232 family)